MSEENLFIWSMKNYIVIFEFTELGDILEIKLHFI